MTVLVDTSVWIGHFKLRNEQLASLLEAGLVVCHPYVIVEVACGTPPRRSAILDMMADLEQVPQATHEELLAFVAARELQGRGCGFVDVSLLASTLLTDHVRLWSLDRRLDAVAADLGRAYRPALSA